MVELAGNRICAFLPNSPTLIGMRDIGSIGTMGASLYDVIMAVNHFCGTLNSKPLGPFCPSRIMSRVHRSVPDKHSNHEPAAPSTAHSSSPPGPAGDTSPRARLCRIRHNLFWPWPPTHGNEAGSTCVPRPLRHDCACHNLAAYVARVVPCVSPPHYPR